MTSVTLMCIVTAVDESPVTVTSYNWNCSMRSSCNFLSYLSAQTQQNITANNLLARDAGTVRCTATIGGTDYISDPLILRISGKLDIYNFIILLSRNVNCCS